MSANAFSSLTVDVTGIVGPLLGAGLVAAGGVAITLGVDAASFVVSALCLPALGRLPGSRDPARDALVGRGTATGVTCGKGSGW